jgi:type VI secretion system secreted protein VgrG
MMFAVTSAQIGMQASGEIYMQAPNMFVEAPASITLRSGPSFIHISPVGISLSGPMLRLNSGGSPGKSMVQAQMPKTLAQIAIPPEKPKKPELQKKPEL